jgi:hypothetical protein
MDTLYISLGEHQTSQENALRQLSNKFLHLESRRLKYVSQLENTSVWEQIEKQLDFNPDFTFMQIQQAGIIDEETVRKLPGVKVNWTGDVRQSVPEWMIPLAPYCTLAFSNPRDVSFCKALGYSSVYLDIGFEEGIYTPSESSEDIEKTVTPAVFFGNNYGERFPLSRFRRELITELSRKRLITVYGFGWGDIPATNLMDDPKKEAAILRGAGIVLNLSHFDIEGYTSDRFHRALACGAFVISHSEIRPPYLHKHHYVYANTKEQIIGSIRRYSFLPEERSRIAKEGSKLMWEEGTWKSQFTSLIEQVNV